MSDMLAMPQSKQVCLYGYPTASYGSEDVLICHMCAMLHSVASSCRADGLSMQLEAWVEQTKRVGTAYLSFSGFPGLQKERPRALANPAPKDVLFKA